jgi:hypothetical protein
LLFEATNRPKALSGSSSITPTVIVERAVVMQQHASVRAPLVKAVGHAGQTRMIAELRAQQRRA